MHFEVLLWLFFTYTGNFKQNSARLYNCNKVVEGTFTFTHSGFGRLSCYRAVRKDSDKRFSFTLQRSGNSYPAGFNLP
jgi:hypothetical protein